MADRYETDYRSPGPVWRGPWDDPDPEPPLDIPEGADVTVLPSGTVIVWVWED
jgi:hypothetical protein